MNLKDFLLEDGDIVCSIEHEHGRSRSLLNAYELSDDLVIYFSFARTNSPISLHVDFFNDNSAEPCLSSVANWVALAEGNDVFALALPAQTLGVGLYFYRLRSRYYQMTLYGYKCGSLIKFDRCERLRNMCQITISDFKYPPPYKLYGGIIYHIFVDRFNRGNRRFSKHGAKIVEGEWDIIPEYPEYSGAFVKNDTFYGGTLYGIADKLDYISTLGVTAIYLSPIFSSASNHRYDTADYESVDELLGGDEALAYLVEKCNRKGISVILDGVFNHTGADSIYFNKYGNYGDVGAYRSEKSKYYDWYTFDVYPHKYTCWWNIDILPRINIDNQSCAEYFIGDNGIIQKYRSLGIYGFRLDVADELSDTFIEKIKSQLSKDGESVLYGEVWEDASNKIAYEKRKTYYLGKELDGVMNYPLRKGVVDFITGQGTNSLYYAIQEVMSNAPKRISDAQMNMLGSHDTERILTVLGSDIDIGASNAELRLKRLTNKERRMAKRRLFMAYTVIATLPGIPVIFYGDEVGLEGYKDPFNRMPYPWGREDSEILDFYRCIANVRLNEKIYETGDFRLLFLSDEMLIFLREDGQESLVTVVNNSAEQKKLDFSDDARALILQNVGRTHTLKAYSAEIYKVKTKTTLSLTGD